MAQSEITYGEKKSLENPAWAERRQLTTTLEMTKTASPSESPCQLLRLDAPSLWGKVRLPSPCLDLLWPVRFYSSRLGGHLD